MRTPKIDAENQDPKKAAENLRLMISALSTVSFYARINHGDKADDYGAIVNPILKKLGLPTGQLL